MWTAQIFLETIFIVCKQQEKPCLDKIEFQSRASHPRCIPLDLGMLSVKTRTFLRLFLLPANRGMVLENRGSVLYSKQFNSGV